MFKRSLAVITIILAGTTAGIGQEVEVERYNITATVDLGASALDVRANLAILTPRDTSRSRLYLRLTKQATVKSASVNGAPARFDATEDRRVTTLNQIMIEPKAPIGPGTRALVELGYRIEAQESNALVSVYPGEVMMAPESVWVPMPSTMFTMHGASTAPFSLTVNAPGAGPNFRAASAGVLKSEAENSGFTFDQTLNSLPFFVAGNYASPVIEDHGGIRVEILVQPGLTSAVGGSDSTVSEQVSRMGAEAGHIIGFLTKVLGPLPPGAAFRIIASPRASHITIPGALVINQQVFRQETLDALTIERLADAIARLWTDGRVRIRGQESRSAQPDRPAQRARSTVFLRDSLPRYLAALYFEDRYGAEAAAEVFRRMRWSYTPVARSRRDAELGIHSMMLPTYAAAAFAKGPLVLRLIAETAGRDKLLSAVRSLFAGPLDRPVTNEIFGSELQKAGGDQVVQVYQQWVESVIEPDLIIGVPLPGDGPDSQKVNLRNLGDGNITVSVLAITASGKRLTVSGMVPSEDIVSIAIPTGEKITSIEVDPAKLVIQTDYDNDAKPVRTSAYTHFNESITHFNKGEFTEAEARLREALLIDPGNSLLHSWLARSLSAQNKQEEAAAAAAAALKVTPPLSSAVAWGNLILGQIALDRSRQPEAIRHLRQAIVHADELPAQLAAREMLVAAERAAGPASAEDSIRGFIQQLDVLIRQPSSDKLFGIVIRNNLKRFVQGLAVSPPAAWTTEILRIDRIDADRVALDVSLKVRAEGKDQAGTALFILYRTGNSWMLEDVQLFNVK